ncbi:FAD-dependent oxidoreductase [Lacticaseibacillus nasuensis]|uniref:FAD-dependent oxidoreductase n=1 Tax=Lacticaseibacillus nasuensis TaxID=944671 RepID=UPI0022453053|nr:FAD-dependent oxidoreductase [Lacticaseibacillus nasuensis]MCX2455906.1 FAD-dependent oxidoreductase [Lacticaseibacillus nasuensis]
MRIAVIGCTHAGTAAVNQIIATHPETQVDVFERRHDITFLSCGIALYLEGTVKRLEDMFYSDVETLSKLGPNVHMHMGHDVVAVDAKAHQLTAQNLDTGEQFTQPYDKLVMTTGSYPTVPPLQGISVPGVLMCKNYDDARAIKASAATAKTIAIIGGGYIGVELAEAYSRTGHDVIFINGVHGVLAHYVDRDIAALIVKELEAHGVTNFLDETALKFDSDGKQVYIQTDKGERHADLAVVATGFLPMTDLLVGQVKMMKNGAIHVNDYMQTSDPDIYAAGDTVAVHFNPTGQDQYAPLATNAVRQGQLAGINLFGNKVKYMGTQSTSAMRIYDKVMACSGMTAKRAKEAGFNVGAVTFTDNYRGEFMPSTTTVTMRLVWDQDNRQILGGQLFSAYDITQSANLLSVMIQNKNTIDDLAYVDMLFNPHYDKPWNYLNLLGQVAQHHADELGK